MLTQELVVKFTFCENNIAFEIFSWKIIHIYYKFHEVLQNIWLLTIIATRQFLKWNKIN